MASEEQAWEGYLDAIGLTSGGGLNNASNAGASSVSGQQGGDSARVDSSTHITAAVSTDGGPATQGIQGKSGENTSPHESEADRRKRILKPGDFNTVDGPTQTRNLPRACEQTEKFLKDTGKDIAIQSAFAWLFFWRAKGTGAANNATKTVAPNGIKEILDDLPGKTGKTGPVKTVTDAKALSSLFNTLSKGSKAVNSGSYPGPVKELPDGTIIRMRPSSKSGGAAIDITMPGGQIIKVHIQ